MLRFVGIAIGVAFGAKAISILMAFRTVAWTAALPFLKIAAIITLVTLLLEVKTERLIHGHKLRCCGLTE